MKVAYIQDAEPERVSEVLQDFLKERGAILTEHTRSHIRFEGLTQAGAREGNPDWRSAFTWTKGGYIGTYQHSGEREVEVRLKVYASGPKKWFWRIVAAELLAAIAVIALNPSSTLWVLAAVILYAVLAMAFVTYLATWRSSDLVEEELFDTLVARLREQAPAIGAANASVHTDEERRLRQFEEEVEAEILAKRLAEERKAHLKAAPALASAAGAPEPGAEDGEAKRRRLEELRREIAARKSDGED